MDSKQIMLDFINDDAPRDKILSDLTDAVRPTEVFTAYWEFAYERQQIMLKRARGLTKPWTTNSVLEQYRFTNVFRAEDRVSQYLIKNVIYRGKQKPEEVFFRIILFKIFNRIDTWEALERQFGELRWETYDFDAYNSFLNKLMNAGVKIYSAAYVMPSAQSAFGLKRKHSNHLKLIERMMHDNLPKRLKTSRSLEEVYRTIAAYPSMGPFLAFQYTIDINYSDLIDFDENDFVVAGPGARDGIHKCFVSIDGHSYEDIIRMVTEKQVEYFNETGKPPVTLFGRRLHLIDCQNLFCEISKYARVNFPHRTSPSKRTRIKQRFHVNPKPIELWFPPKWNLHVDLREK